MRISDKKTSILWLIAILSILPLWAQNRGKNKTEFFRGKEAATNEVLVKFRPTTFQSVLEAQAAGEVDESEWVGGTGLLRLHSSRKNVATLVSELSARSDVEYAEPNYIVHTTAIPNDPRFGELWGLQNTGQIIQASVGVPGADIKATAAWAISTGARASKCLRAFGSVTAASSTDAIDSAVQADAAFAATGGSNVRVLSYSWGGGALSQALLDEINRANANDMLLVAAAGNSISNND